MMKDQIDAASNIRRGTAFGVALWISLLAVNLPAAAEVAKLAREVDGAAFVGDTERLQELHGELSSLLQSEQSNEVGYAVAYTEYRLATAVSQTGTAEANAEAAALLAAAQERLESVVESAADGSALLVEGLTLLSAVMGFRIGLEPALGMRLGARSGQLLSKALRIDPKNPRVHLQDGVSKYNTPKMWGGSKKKAEVSLRRAVSLFAEAQDQGAWPNWGYLDALAWLGQALADQGKVDEARAAYQQALALNPEMGWVRYQLLPALDG